MRKKIAAIAGRDIINLMAQSFTTTGGESHGFPQTEWKTVIDARDRDSINYKQSLETLVATYWKPVYIYIRLAWAKNNDDAKELTQQFFTTFLEKDFLKNVEPEKGRFRTYVKKALKNFLIDTRRIASAQKRGGGSVPVQIDNVDIGTIKKDGPADPAEQFEIAWAKNTFDTAIKNMKKQLIGQGKEIYYKVFEQYYYEDGLKERTRKEIAGELGITESDFKNYLVYAKTLLGRALREEIARSVLDTSLVEDELKYLFAVLKRDEI